MNVLSSGRALAEQSTPAGSRHPLSYGIYIHVPFCVQKCAYCSFYSVSGQNKWFDQYVGAVKTLIGGEALSDWHTGRQLESIFFGGGTPTVLPPEQLIELLQECGRNFGGIFAEMEVSVEVNPATIDYSGLVELRQAGFNRISIGVQSLDDSDLARLGRVHTAAEARETVFQAQKAGFANLSLDLMYGLPGQDLTSWQQTLEKAFSLSPDHISMYELTIEGKTPFAVLAGQGSLDLPDEDEILAMMDHAGMIVQQCGLNRYEISNYARPGYECCHNINYWNNGSYLGFGPGAVSCQSGRRMTMVADVEQFCCRVQRSESVLVDEEELTVEERFRETVIMGLRMLAGLSLNGLETRFGINLLEYYGETLDRLLQQGLIEIQQGRIRLTRQGLLLANSVMAELV